MRKIIRFKEKNLKTKSLIWFVLGASFPFLVANADLVINPQITNSIAYIKQFFVTSDGTNAGTLGVSLQSSGVFSTKYCDLSGANCKTISELSDISAQLAGLSALYMTSGQVDSKISLFSGQLLSYLFVNYYDKTGTDTLLANYYDKTGTNTLLANYYDKTGTNTLLTNYYDKTGTNTLLANYYDKTDIDGKGYLSGSQVNLLAKTLSLSCLDGQIAKMSGSNWVCAGDSIGSPQDLSNYATLTYLSTNHYTKSTIDANYYKKTEIDGTLLGYYTKTEINNKGYITAAQVASNETDPDYNASSWASTTNNSSNWDAAFDWGNHKNEGYLKSADLSPYYTKTEIDNKGYITSSVLSNYATTASLSAYATIASLSIGNWNSAYTFVNDATTSNRLYIDTTNNRIGIGTNTPGAKLTVLDGNIRLQNTTDVKAFDIGYDETDNNFYIDEYGVNKWFFIKAGGNVGVGTGDPGYKFTVVGTGLFTKSVYAEAFLYNSDQRLKTNILPIVNPLLKIDQLNGYTFDWKSDGRHDIGVIAQEVEPIFPEAVVTKENGYKTVNYPSLVAPLISAVKELYHNYLDQQAEIDALKVEIASLKTMLQQNK